MAFIFTMHSHRRDMSAAAALPAISEDGNDLDIRPAGTGTAANNRTNTSMRAATGMPPMAARPWARIQSSDSPRAYFAMSDASGSDTDHEQEKRLAELRENPQIAKRGGWKRLAVAAVITILCIVGLVVGLVVGLNHRNNSNNSSNSTSSGNSTYTAGFPSGSYAVQTYLNTITTNCTSNPSTWRCYPYTTYAESSTLSAATFSWIITAIPPVNANPPTYTISSTNNPFSLVFSSTPLTLMEAGTDTEHYSFVLTGLTKPVVPAVALTSSNVATTCYFNQTHLEAKLYTKMGKTYPPSTSPSGDSGSNGQGGVWSSWPYAATVLQTASGGQDVPQCFDTQGHSIGTFTPETGGECSCEYQNFGA